MLRTIGLLLGATVLLSSLASVLAKTSEGVPIATAQALGERLFHDPILSRDRTISCASCHRPERAYADDRAYSIGIGGQPTHRNVPSAMNVRGRINGFFWDMRAASLAAQALEPIRNPEEMDLPVEEAVQRLREDPDYARDFQSIFDRAPDADALAQVLTAFELTLETTDSAYDRYQSGDRSSLSASALRGRTLFRGKALCLACHHGEDFNSPLPRNIGLYDGKNLVDAGVGAITGNPDDLGKFTVPGLRNIAVTAPYMHNGMFGTLREVIDYYDDPDTFGIDSINRDPLLDASLGLSEQEKLDLEAFMESLTDSRFLPPSSTRPTEGTRQ